MKAQNLIILLGLAGAISPITYNLQHKRNAKDSNNNLRVLLSESASEREVVEVPVMEYEDDNKPSKRMRNDDHVHLNVADGDVGGGGGVGGGVGC